MIWGRLTSCLSKWRRRKLSALPEAPPSLRSVVCSPSFSGRENCLILGPTSVGSCSLDPETPRQALRILERLEPDADLVNNLDFYRAGLERFGDSWRYADIITVLFAATKMIQPTSYLEIGVRRGRSMAMVASLCPTCDIVGFDMWVPNYANLPNPGPEFVRAEMKKLGHSGCLELISGDSRETVPRYFRENPEAYFDVITVDGDHSETGATRDLLAVIPRLKLGGILVFDDITHPLHPYLKDVWQTTVESDSRFLPWRFAELGNGVALALRRVDAPSRSG